MYRAGEMAARGELSLDEASQRLKVSKMTVLRLISAGTITARQVCKGAPWAIPEEQIAVLEGVSPGEWRARTGNPDQKTLDLQ